MPGTEEVHRAEEKRGQRLAWQWPLKGQTLGLQLPFELAVRAEKAGVRRSVGMYRLLPYCAVRLVEGLDDASLLHLRGVQVGLCEPLADAARVSGPCVRRCGDWNVREEQYGVWKCLSQADLQRLPDVQISMGTEWTFGCRAELLAFVQAAAKAQADFCVWRQGITFKAVRLHAPRPPGERAQGPRAPKLPEGRILACCTSLVGMQYGSFAVTLWLVDETPDKQEPTVSLRLHGVDVNTAWEERWDWVVFRARCHLDMDYCSQHNPYLRREVWQRFLQTEERPPLPLFFVAELDDLD